MTPQELDVRLAAAIPIVRAAGELALRFFRDRGSLAIEHKGQQDLVSIADRAVEDLLRERLAAAFPEDDVLGNPRDDEPGGRTYGFHSAVSHIIFDAVLWQRQGKSLGKRVDHDHP